MNNLSFEVNWFFLLLEDSCSRKVRDMWYVVLFELGVFVFLG